MRQNGLERTALIHSFNRYMVECEFFVDVHDVCCRVVVLIDTWWNVN